MSIARSAPKGALLLIITGILATPAAARIDSSSAFTQQALGPSVVEAVQPLSTRSRIEFTEEAGRFSRRRFLRGAGTTAFTAALRWSVPLALIGEMIHSARLHAQGYRESVGSTYVQPITFQAYDAGKVDASADLQTALQLLDHFLNDYRAVITALQTNPSDSMRNFNAQRVKFAEALYAIPSFRERLLKQLDSTKMPLSPDALPVNQILYTGLPAYLADYGLLLQIAYPSITEAKYFIPFADQMYFMERWWVYKVSAIDHSARFIWGDAVAADELTVDSYFIFHGHPLAFEQPTGWNRGLTIYQNNVVFEKGVINAVAILKKEFAPTDPAAAVILTLTWETAREKFPLFKSNPLEFSRYFLEMQETLHPHSTGQREQWVREQTRYHERTHLQSQRQGLYPVSSHISTIWSEFDETINHRLVMDETNARLSQARHVSPTYRPLELWRLLEEVASPEMGHYERMESYILTDLLLQYLSLHFKEYPELAPSIRPMEPLRMQLAGNLYRLTPESLGRAWDGVHQYWISHQSDIKIPVKIDPLALLKDPLPHAGKKTLGAAGALGILPVLREFRAAA